MKALCDLFWTCHALLALSLANKSLVHFSHSKAKTKAVCSQHTKETTAGPFHFFHMGPMSDVAFWTCHALLALWLAYKVWHISATAKQKPRLYAASTTRKPLLDHFIYSLWVQ
jgi:hypothetical protein